MTTLVPELSIAPAATATADRLHNAPLPQLLAQVFDVDLPKLPAPFMTAEI